jgi:hypothetical protein
VEPDGIGAGAIRTADDQNGSLGSGKNKRERAYEMKAIHANARNGILLCLFLVLAGATPAAGTASWNRDDGTWSDSSCWFGGDPNSSTAAAIGNIVHNGGISRIKSGTAQCAGLYIAEGTYQGSLFIEGGDLAVYPSERPCLDPEIIVEEDGTVLHSDGDVYWDASTCERGVELDVAGLWRMHGTRSPTLRTEYLDAHIGTISDGRFEQWAGTHYADGGVYVYGVDTQSTYELGDPNDPIDL